MATFRVGVGSFNINDGSVGIGTEGSGHGNLKVEGTIKSKSIDVLGVSTFTRYSGFSADNININNRDLTLSGEYSTTGDVVVEDGASLKVGVGSTACIGTVESVNVKNHFSVPAGDTNQRNESTGYSEGVIRFNSDLNNMEFFNGNEWRQFNYQLDIQNSPSSRGRAVFTTNAGGNKLDFVNMSSLGNALMFGVLGNGNRHYGCASEIRGLWAGGYNPSNTNVIEYITIASAGDGIDFGDLTENRRALAAASSSTRGIWGGGYAPTGGGAPNRTNTIQYVEIQTLGNTSDFGDLKSTQVSNAAAASPTRAIFSGGYTAPYQYDVITTASTGNANRFGDMLVPMARHAGCSNSTRGVFGSGRAVNPYGVITAELEYITIASEGNGIYFGDLSLKRNMLAAASSPIRGLFAGGYDTPVLYNTIDYITFSSAGNAIDFGDCIETKRGTSGLSDSHGGLGGY